MVLERLAIEPRFCGPPDTADGGYVAGRLARHLDGPVEVTLRAPTPLERELRIETNDTGDLVLLDGPTTLAQARRAPVELEPPAPPSFDEAQARARSCRAFETHPYPGSFACGPDREPGDGLRIFPGPVAGTDRVAAPWLPDASLSGADGAVQPEFVWSALDSSSSFPLLEDPESQSLEPMVLGRLAAAVTGCPEPGERCVVVAWPLGIDGRRGFAGSAVYGGDGRLLGLARATWISLAGRS